MSQTSAPAGEPLLSVKNLVTVFDTDSGTVRAVDRVSFDVHPGETLAIVGESGCGKSVTAMSILRIVSSPGRVESGQILFHGQDLLLLPESGMRSVRGRAISMIFQEPMTSLNPVFTIGDQVAEPLRVHKGLSRKQALCEAVRLLGEVAIPDPSRRVKDYPHQLSGGMRQRVMIAMALACDPELIIADEPTTALDVTIQAQILDILQGLREKRGLAVLLITHDLGVVAETCERAVVMYAGRVVETGSVKRLFARPEHPYTKGLLGSIPSRARKGARLPAIRGMVPSLRNLPAGCAFEPRCEETMSRCSGERPELYAIAGGGGISRCFLSDPEMNRAGSPPVVSWKAP